MTDRQTQMTPQPKAAKSSYSRAEWMTLLAEAPVVELEAGLSQTFGLNRMLTIGMEFAAPKVAERAHDSECYCREAEAPIKG